MKNNVQPTEIETTMIVITPEQLLEHWQGHRRITRRVIEAFPEDKLFNFAVGGMRPFSALAVEMIQMAEPGLDGVITGKWKSFKDILSEFEAIQPKTKKELLQLWDKTTDVINKVWSQIPVERFQETDLAFGMWEGQNHTTVWYWIDNEIHHRAQGYVYLRALGIEPPAFYDRS